MGIREFIVLVGIGLALVAPLPAFPDNDEIIIVPIVCDDGCIEAYVE